MIEERPFKWWAKRAEAADDGDVSAGGRREGMEAGMKDQAMNRTITRDLVILRGDDTDDQIAQDLRLDSHPGDGMTLGWLVDDHGENRRALSSLIWDITGGVLSKPDADQELVTQIAGQRFVRDILEDHPALAENEAFRPVLEKHFMAREIEDEIEIARRRIAGHRVCALLPGYPVLDLGPA